MKKFLSLSLLLLFIGLMLPSSIHAQKNVFEDVGVEFNSSKIIPISTPFSNVSDQSEKSLPLPSNLTNYEVLKLDLKTLQALNLNKGKSFKLNIPLSKKSTSLELDLIESVIFTPDFKLRTSKGDILPSEVDLGSHYKGVIHGDENSIVAISIFENEISGIISNNEGNWNLGRLDIEDNQDTYILFLDKDLQSNFDIGCDTPDDGKGYSPEELQFDEAEKGVGDCVRVYVEVDNEIYVDKGGLSGATAFINGAFNEVITLYDNDGITMVISDMLVWDVVDPYTSTNSSTRLSQFQNSSTANNFDGDLAHLVDLGSSGIAAGFAGLCNANENLSMCISGVFNTYSTVPTWSWTVSVLTHEMGHLLGSRHTHACVWNGNNTAIDGCSNTEGNCRKPRPLPQNGGTIMSYCHNTNVGINFNLGFGPQPTAVILNNIATAGCMPGCGNNPCNNGVQDPGEDGVDCGGSCPACPTCDDGIQNGDETGIDCGGSCADCPPSLCDAPGGLYADQIRPKKARLNWSAVNLASTYTARIRAVNGTYQENTVSGTKITYTGLTNGTTYEWGVRTNCTNNDQSEWSQTCTFTAGNSGSGGCGANVFNPELGLSLYPIPAKDEIYLSLPSSYNTNSTIEIYDLMGRKQAIQHHLDYSELVFNTSNFKTGVYFLRYSDDSFQKTIKFVIKE